MDMARGDASRGTRGGDGRAVWSGAREQGRPGVTVHCHGAQSQCLLTQYALGALPMVSSNSARLPFEKRGLSSAHSRTVFCCCTVSAGRTGGEQSFSFASVMAARYLHQVLTRVWVRRGST